MDAVDQPVLRHQGKVGAIDLAVSVQIARKFKGAVDLNVEVFFLIPLAQDVGSTGHGEDHFIHIQGRVGIQPQIEVVSDGGLTVGNTAALASSLVK